MTEGSTVWKTAPFGSTFKIRYGKASPKDSRTADGGVPVIGSAGEMARTATPLVSEACLVIGRKGNVGQTHLAMSGAWPTDTTYYVTMRPEIEPKFLEYQLIAMDLRRFDSSTATPSLRRQDLESINIVLPELDEQQRIVEVIEDHLSRLAGASHLVADANRRVARMWQSALHTEMRGPTVRLAEIATDAGYGTSIKCTTSGRGLPVVRIPNLVGGGIDLSDEKRAEDTTVDLRKLLLKKGDVLIVRTNGSKDLIGRSAVVDRDWDAAFASYLIRYRLDPLRVDPRWVHFALESPQIRSTIERMAASSAGQHNLGLKKLDSLELPCPSTELQAAKLERLHEIEVARAQLAATVTAIQKRTEVLRRAVLSAAFSGKLTGRRTDQEAIDKLAESHSSWPETAVNA